MDDLSNSSAEAPHFVVPAEYYEAPQTTRIVPRWVPFGCGGAALVFLIVVFAGGAMISGGGGGSLLDTLFGKLQSEVDKQFTKDVTPAQRQAFDNEMDLLRQRIRASKLNIEKLQPFMRAVRDASDDDRITPDEAEKLTAAAREARGK